MAKKASKARESRVNIQISDRLRGGAEPELPFRVLVTQMTMLMPFLKNQKKPNQKKKTSPLKTRTKGK